ncbi:envelope glycoprotein M [Human betaherpesvirus 5]|uniref:Envelope glycoprotein M n=1 Tax=Human cytomegalovirus TaxID=10359 RepID=C8BKP6_HCMV|nr:envelope glycoprotein M [Human betaherpesvirus 5]WNA13295.1 envelope glycoprotein M [Cytomegalovirus humanbeta5]ACS93431.1 envelope glycoprotein M [Human betaherpesvirus 5]ACU83749.1 envelope glycoprotein M [Human betaherpesvirus 5]ACZ80340.1 envelope glycoprotein M [Human betaherpesvirus 5]
MAPSHVDKVNTRTWSASIVFMVLTFVNVSVHLVLSNFPHLGYPCVYYHVVDFERLNMSAYNVMHLHTPMLFLDSVQLVCYAVFMQLVFLAVTIYYLVCWIKISMRKDKGMSLNQSTRDISYMGDSLTAFLFILSMDTFQLFTLTMSFRLPSMIAFMAAVHFFCLTIFNVSMVTQYRSFKRSLFFFSRLHPKLKGTVQFRTLIVNLVEMALGFNTTVVAMALCYGFGNNFFVRTGHMVLAVFVVYAIISIIYFLLIEAVFFQYVKVQFGYHLGAFFGLCGLIYPIVQYGAFTIGDDYRTGISWSFGMLFFIWAMFTTCRAVRYFRGRGSGSVKYQALATASGEEVAALSHHDSLESRRLREEEDDDDDEDFEDA